VGQLADNVQDFAKDKPRYQKGMIQDALFDYLAAACGPASQQTVDRSLVPPNELTVWDIPHDTENNCKHYLSYPPSL